MTIRLPAPHAWERVPGAPDGEDWFECAKCWATFAFDHADQSEHYKPGDGTCEDDDMPEWCRQYAGPHPITRKGS